MSYIPDCRTDEDYNEKNLSDERDIAPLRAYDLAIEDIDTLFANLDVYEVRVDLRPSDFQAAADEIQEMAKDWMEMHRNEMIVSLLDNEMDGAECD